MEDTKNEIRSIIDVKIYDEKELRAIVQDFTITDNKIDLDKPIHQDGFLFKIDIEILIDKIFISPLSDDWIFNLIQSLIQRFGYSFPLIKSTLYKSPM